MMIEVLGALSGAGLGLALGVIRRLVLENSRLRRQLFALGDDGPPWQPLHCNHCGAELELWVREAPVDRGAIYSALCRDCR